MNKIPSALTIFYFQFWQNICSEKALQIDKFTGLCCPMLRGKHEKEDTFVTIYKKKHNPGKKYHDGHNLKSTKLTPVKEKVISQEGEYFSPVITEPEACKE